MTMDRPKPTVARRTGRHGPHDKATRLDLARAFGMMLGPPALLDLFVGGSALLASRGWLARRPRTRFERVLRPFVALGAAAPVVYLLAVRPRMQRWGATYEEIRQPLPGDELIPDPAFESTRAVTVNAPVEAVWPWLAQVGQDRGGFYSYD